MKNVMILFLVLFLLPTVDAQPIIVSPNENVEDGLMLNGISSDEFLLDSAQVCNNNNVLNVGEQCDDGNNNPNDGCHECRYVVPTNGQVHYVDKNNVMGLGCDPNGDGISIPWCDLPQVDAHQFNPGDSVVFRQGDYDWFGKQGRPAAAYTYMDVEVSGTGTANNPIVVMAYPGEEVILRQEYGTPDSCDYSWGCAVIGPGGEYQIFQGFKFYGSFTILPSNTIVRGNEFIGFSSPMGGTNGFGIHLWSGENVLIRNNYIRDWVGAGDDRIFGIVSRENNKNLIVENNFLENNVNHFIPKWGADGQIVRKNVLKDALRVTGGTRFCGGDSFAVCRNVEYSQNLYINSVVGQVAAGNADPVNRTVKNNLFIGGVQRPASSSIDYPDVTYYNNIRVGSGIAYVLSSTTDSLGYSDYNLWNIFDYARIGYSTQIGFSEWQNTFGYDRNSIQADPLFNDNGRYTLSDNSPARGAGRFGEDLGLYPDGDTSVAIGPTWIAVPVVSDCGNGVLDPGELCDGTNLNGQSCLGLGFDSGSLSCNPNTCQFDTSQCTYSSVCNNNGICDSGETFDSCPSDCEPYVGCGDGLCSVDEDCNSCSLDCGVCPVDPNEIILDNQDAASRQDGTWTLQTFAYSTIYGDNFYRSPNTAGHWFEYVTTLEPGVYDLSAWWTTFSGNAVDVSYEIINDDAIFVVNGISHRTGGSQWNLLGTYDLSGTTIVRVVSGTAGTYGGSIADAVRFVRVGDLEGSNPCVINGLSWSVSSVVFGSPVSLFIDSENCDSESLVLQLRELDSGSFDVVSGFPSFVSGAESSLSWVPVQLSESDGSLDNEFVVLAYPELDPSNVVESDVLTAVMKSSRKKPFNVRDDSFVGRAYDFGVLGYGGLVLALLVGLFVLHRKGKLRLKK